MPDGFRNPFTGNMGRTNDTARDPFEEPDVTLAMAAELLGRCDAFQLPLFALLALYGLRPSELCFLMRENLADGWLKAACLPGLVYQTKGRRDKRLPLIEPLPALLAGVPAAPGQGLLFVRRDVTAGTVKPPLLGRSLPELERELEHRVRRTPRLTAQARPRLRNAVLKEAGGITYDHLEHEFRRLARQLDWLAAATLKDFRHLFATALENAGTPLFSRRYLLGHSPGRSALVSYTHLTELRQHYEQAAARTLGPLVEAITRRAGELALL